VGRQVAAVAAVHGGIELPCGGQREAGPLAARILRRLVAGDLDDAETTAFAAGLVDGLLIGEPFGVLDDVLDVVDAGFIGPADGHEAGEVVVLGGGERERQRRVGVERVARLVEFGGVVAVAGVLRCSVAGDEANCGGGGAEHVAEFGDRVRHAGRDLRGGQRLACHIGGDDDLRREYVLDRIKVVALVVCCHSMSFQTKRPYTLCRA